VCYMKSNIVYGEGPLEVPISKIELHCMHNDYRCKYLLLESCVVDSGYRKQIGTRKICTHGDFKKYIDDHNCPYWCPLKRGIPHDRSICL